MTRRSCRHHPGPADDSSQATAALSRHHLLPTARSAPSRIGRSLVLQTTNALRNQKGRSPVYTKVLLEGRRSRVPTLVVTIDEAGLLPQLLQAHGWARFGQQPPTLSRGELIITHQHLHLVVDGTTLANGINPASPPGWWKAVDDADGVCAVVVFPPGEISAMENTTGYLTRALRHTDRAVFAVLPLLT